MLSVKILYFKGANSQFLMSLEEEYSSRLKKFCKLELCELDSSKFSKLPASTQLSREAEMITQQISSGLIIALTEDGKEFTSVGFADYIGKSTITNSKIYFLIGSANGLDASIIKTAQLKLSLSKMTFTSQMARMLLLEQIYRGFTILNNLPYHKKGV